MTSSSFAVSVVGAEGSFVKVTVSAGGRTGALMAISAVAKVRSLPLPTKLEESRDQRGFVWRTEVEGVGLEAREVCDVANSPPVDDRLVGLLGLLRGRGRNAVLFLADLQPLGVETIFWLTDNGLLSESLDWISDEGEERPVEREVGRCGKPFYRRLDDGELVSFDEVSVSFRPTEKLNALRALPSHGECSCDHPPEDHCPITGSCLHTNFMVGPCPCEATLPEVREALSSAWSRHRTRRRP